MFTNPVLNWALLLMAVSALAMLVNYWATGGSREDCPLCLEKVKKGAIVCPHCKSKIG